MNKGHLDHVTLLPELEVAGDEVKELKNSAATAMKGNSTGPGHNQSSESSILK